MVCYLIKHTFSVVPIPIEVDVSGGVCIGIKSFLSQCHLFAELNHMIMMQRTS